MTKISVVIAAYNSMSYLPETLDSVLSQTFTDFEVLIIDDGSSDNIVAWASEITDPRVKLITQKNQGVAGARNTGIAHARGKYVAFLDADDLWAPTKLEKQIQCFESKPEVGLVYTWTLLVDQQGRSMGSVIAAHTEGNAWEELLVGDVVGSGSSAMIRRSCFDKVGLFDLEIPHIPDCDMWARVAAHYPIAVVKEILVYYRQHPSGMSRDYEKQAKDSRVKIEKAFAQAPFELLHLRSKAYAYAFLWLAWKVIFDGGDPTKARDFARQAVLHYPPMRYSTKHIRLQVTLAIIKLFGSSFYLQLKNWKHKLQGSSLQYHH